MQERSHVLLVEEEDMYRDLAQAEWRLPHALFAMEVGACDVTSVADGDRYFLRKHQPLPEDNRAR